MGDMCWMLRRTVELRYWQCGVRDVQVVQSTVHNNTRELFECPVF
jgi:hypothetical protein